MSNFYLKKNKIGFKLSATTSLLIVNVVCFIIFSILLLINENFIDYIALKPSNVFQGKYLWTFLTSMFMHNPLGPESLFPFHLFVNMLSLMSIGKLVEKILGPKRYILFYLASGLFAGILFVLSSLVLTSDYNTFAVGASGALFGFIGLLMILTPNLPVYIMFIPIPIKMKYAGVGMLVGLWAISILGGLPIGNIAHLGGALSGLAFGFYLKVKYKKKTKYIQKLFS